MNYYSVSHTICARFCVAITIKKIWLTYTLYLNSVYRFVPLGVAHSYWKVSTSVMPQILTVKVNDVRYHACRDMVFSISKVSPRIPGLGILIVERLTKETVITIVLRLKVKLGQGSNRGRTHNLPDIMRSNISPRLWWQRDIVVSRWLWKVPVC